MKNKILVINGPNLEILGKREVEIYGNKTLEEINASLKDKSYENKFEIDFFQSNTEGEIVNKINSLEKNYKGIIINPAAYTHTSFAIFDSLNNLNIIKIEVHISNIYKREDFRKKSVTAGACDAVISGFGVKGYDLALEYIMNKND
ncbi:type II 3-dehydroquinate dehydratase [Alphaproteobacteria bacterium]|nr:type II 3-dehydroquinate dehydratase [Alphaproteobacteria bacterium]